MSKTETAKALFKHLGYLFGGISLILMTLFLLGYIMDELVQIFGLTTMPFLAELAPLVIMFTGVAWGGYFIWKGLPAGDIIFGLVCKLADAIVLNRMSRRAKILVGNPPGLAGMIILIIAVVQTAVRSGLFSRGFFNGDTPLTPNFVTPLWPIGIGLFLFWLIVTHGIEPRRREQKSDESVSSIM